MDAMKLGMNWRGQNCLSLTNVLDWKHGTVSSRCNNFITKEGCKVLAYVNDILVVSLKFYDRLPDLFTGLGLPMNIDKKTPPSKLLTCLGMSVNIEV